MEDKMPLETDGDTIRSEILKLYEQQKQQDGSKRTVEKILSHSYQNYFGGRFFGPPLFKVKWQGSATHYEECASVILEQDQGKEKLGDYLNSLNRRALARIIARHPKLYTIVE